MTIMRWIGGLALAVVVVFAVSATWALATIGIDECKAKSAAQATDVAADEVEAWTDAIGYCAGYSLGSWGGLTALALGVIFMVIWYQRNSQHK